MDCATIPELSAYCASKFDILKTALKLRAGAGRDQEELAEMKTNLVNVMNLLKQLRATVDQEKENIAVAKAVLAAMRTERGRVEHILGNVPDRLPTAPAPPPAAALSAGGSGSGGGGAAPRPAPGRRPPPVVACLSVAEFTSVPQYMRGRMTRDQANRLLDEVNVVLAARYQLVTKPRAQVTDKEKRLWTELKRDEAVEPKGHRFFTEDDFQRFKKAGVTKAQRQLLTILRHTGRTKAARGPGSLVRHLLL